MFKNSYFVMKQWLACSSRGCKIVD